MTSAGIPDSIRDYIYLDTDRARSIYSQLKGGLMESFMKGNATSESSTENVDSRKQSVEQNVLLGTKYEATHVLHDFLFSAIEADLVEAIIDIKSLEVVSKLQPGDYYRVRGIGQIDDTKRFLRILKDFNTLHSYISMAANLPDMQKEIWDIEHRIDIELLSKRDLEKLQKKVISLKPPAIFRKGHQGVPDLTSEMITLWLDLLYPSIFEIKLLPDFSDNLIFRSIVDTEYLRENPSLTFAKHSSRTQAKWTLVGQVSAVYSPKDLDSDEEDADPSDEISENMRDAFENVFSSLKAMEEHLLISASHTTVVTTPLAIYQETRIN